MVRMAATTGSRIDAHATLCGLGIGAEKSWQLTGQLQDDKEHGFHALL